LLSDQAAFLLADLREEHANPDAALPFSQHKLSGVFLAVIAENPVTTAF
jgi:hypothetical protein